MEACMILSFFFFIICKFHQIIYRMPFFSIPEIVRFFKYGINFFFSSEKFYSFLDYFFFVYCLFSFWTYCYTEISYHWFFFLIFFIFFLSHFLTPFHSFLCCCYFRFLNWFPLSQILDLVFDILCCYLRSLLILFCLNTHGFIYFWTFCSLLPLFFISPVSFTHLPECHPVLGD